MSKRKRVENGCQCNGEPRAPSHTLVRTVILFRLIGTRPSCEYTTSQTPQIRCALCAGVVVRRAASSTRAAKARPGRNGRSPFTPSSTNLKEVYSALEAVENSECIRMSTTRQDIFHHVASQCPHQDSTWRDNLDHAPVERRARSTRLVVSGRRDRMKRADASCTSSVAPCRNSISSVSAMARAAGDWMVY